MAGLGGLLAAVQQLRRAPGPLSDGLATLLLADLEWSPEPSNMQTSPVGFGFFQDVSECRVILLVVWSCKYLSTYLACHQHFFLVLASLSPTLGVSMIEHGMFQDWFPSGEPSGEVGWQCIFSAATGRRDVEETGRRGRAEHSASKDFTSKPFVTTWIVQVVGNIFVWLGKMIHDYLVTFITEAVCWFSFRFRNAWM